MKLISDWPKIINSRNPFTRLYSAWNDKSRSFPKYKNGSIIYYGMDLNEKFKNKVRVHNFNIASATGARELMAQESDYSFMNPQIGRIEWSDSKFQQMV